LQKFEISSLEASLFIIFKILQNNFKDFKMLVTVFSGDFRSKDENDIFNQFSECKLEEIEEITPIILEKIKHIFIMNCSYFLNQALKDEPLFPLFRAIIENVKEFNYKLLTLNIEVFLEILKEKRYEILKFLIEKKEIKLLISDEKEITNLLFQNNYNDINKSKSFKKLLGNNVKINLELVVLYYISESPDHYIVKLFIIITNFLRISLNIKATPFRNHLKQRTLQRTPPNLY